MEKDIDEAYWRSIYFFIKSALKCLCRSTYLEFIEDLESAASGVLYVMYHVNESMNTEVLE